MKLNEKKLKNLITSYNLQHREQVIDFIEENPENLDLDELSRIAELVNNGRVDTAAYYTDSTILDTLLDFLPNIDKKEIRVLEPSVGVGNFIQLIVEKYKSADKLIIEVNDIDEKSLKLVSVLNKYRNLPPNVEIIYHNEDFLDQFFDMGISNFDLIIGNPPFLKLSKSEGLKDYSITFNDNVTINIAGFFLQKATMIADRVALILPKYFLSNSDFYETRKRVEKYKIESIIDFGEKGFKGVLIETIAIIVDTQSKPQETLSYSVTKNLYNKQPQTILTSAEFPYWLLYRNDFFNEIASHMNFGVFKVFRDRQLTNKVLKSKGNVKVIKSRNILRDGTGITSIDGYNSFIDSSELGKFAVGKYYERDDVYLSPNMTYYPRVIKKPKDTIVNGSVAVLQNVTNYQITESNLKFLSGPMFEKFYSIARNFSTRSLNIDSNSVYFFGLYK